ncbi:MAG: hypothetical protein H5U38_06460, partial [Calditrichaeota bacterium]|nr:hypothetical protein [Calditrichota bacterium]
MSSEPGMSRAAAQAGLWALLIWLLASVPLAAQYGLSPDFSFGVVDVGRVPMVALPNGHLGWSCSAGYPQSRCRGGAFWHGIDLLVGIPEGPWTPRAFDPAVGDTVTLGPAVAEGVSATAAEGAEDGPDWGPCPGAIGRYFSGEVLLGQLYPDSDMPLVPVMATSTCPETWPLDLYGLHRWPGSWAIDPVTGKERPGVFAGDQELYFCFTDRYAERTYLEAKSYRIGARVECQIRVCGDSYLRDVVFYELSLINDSPYQYNGVYVGLYCDVRWAPFPWYGDLVDFVRREVDPRTGKSVLYEMGYWYKRPHAVEAIRARMGRPDLVVPYIGVMLLRTPLAPSGDGVDNDLDGDIDEAEGEEIGMSGFHLCQAQGSDALRRPIDFYRRKDRDFWQYKVLSGDTCGLPKELQEQFFIPDTTGRLDPHFDSPGGIASRYPEELCDATFLVSSGPFVWPPGDTLRLVAALVIGDDLVGLKRNARTARRVYELGYQRSGPPPAPQAYAVPGNRRVTLYWDRAAEQARDLIFGYQDFEGYRIYRTTVDPLLHQAGIDGAQGADWELMAQFDLRDGYYGLDPQYPHANLGSENGLAHAWTDTTVTNGVTYWYSVCSYDRGVRSDPLYNPEGWPPFPSLESPKGTDPGRDCNLVRVVPGVVPSNYVGPTTVIRPLPGTLGNGSILVEVVDEFRVTGHAYTIAFDDTSRPGNVCYWVYDQDRGATVLAQVPETRGQEGPVFDGLRLWVCGFDTQGVWQDSSGWWRGQETSPCTWRITGRRVGSPPRANYEIRFSGEREKGYATGKTAPFTVWNITSAEKVEWDIFYDSRQDTSEEMKATWTSGDWITFRERVGNRKVHTWTIVLSRPREGQDVPPGVGDVARIVTTKPFRVGDRYLLET